MAATKLFAMKVLEHGGERPRRLDAPQKGRKLALQHGVSHHITVCALVPKETTYELGHDMLDWLLDDQTWTSC